LIIIDVDGDDIWDQTLSLPLNAGVKFEAQHEPQKMTILQRRSKIAKEKGAPCVARSAKM